LRISFIPFMFCSRQIRRAAHACLMAVIAVFLASMTADSAFATCGDYLMTPGEDDHQTHDEDTPNGPAPCRGPSCRGVPHAPLPTTPERPVTYDLERWCASLADDVHSAQTMSQLETDETLLIPAGYASRIDRPPRG
jgi:hypothetical protein